MNESSCLICEKNYLLVKLLKWMPFLVKLQASSLQIYEKITPSCALSKVLLKRKKLYQKYQSKIYRSKSLKKYSNEFTFGITVYKKSNINKTYIHLNFRFEIRYGIGLYQFHYLQFYSMYYMHI